MKIIQKTSLLVFAFLLVFGFSSTSFAQEDLLVDLTNEVEVDLGENLELDEMSNETIVELGLDGEVAISNDLTLQEALEIIEESEEATDDEVISGDVIITTEEYIVIETMAGEYVKVPVTSRKSGQRKRTGAFIALSTAQPGHSLTIVPETSSQTKITGAVFSNGNIANASGSSSYTVSPLAKVMLNGEEASQSELNDIEETDEVTVVTNNEGEVIAITIIEESEIQDVVIDSETQQDTKTPWGWIIAIVAVLGVILVSRKSNK